MDHINNNHDGNHIWLRYTTQFTTAGRTYTFEVGIPVPLGATTEVREQLLREADAGMDQLANFVERRVSQMVQNGQSSQETVPIPTLSAKPLQRSTRPASIPAPQTIPLPTQSRARELHNNTDGVRGGESARSSTAAPVPHATGSLSESGNVISLPQFIKYIKDKMNLTPKQAMDLLNVKALGGLNLREALERLHTLVPNDEPLPGNEAVHLVSVHDHGPSRMNSGPLSNAGRVSVEEDEDELAEEDQRSSRRPLAAFDEEIDPDDAMNLDDELEDLEAIDDALSPEMRALANQRLRNLREARAATSVSPGRLQALHNVVSSQISNEQLLALTSGVWNYNSLKKLKVDQAEALISWAKEDDFVAEVEAVLILLEEERYARGNR